MTVSIYLAASYARKLEMRKCRDDLVKLGNTVTSRWIDRPGDMDCSQQRLNDEPHSKYIQGLLEEDIDDIFSSQFFIMFTGDNKSWGGRHTELGIAMVIESIYAIAIIGPRENIFQCAGRISVYPNWHNFMQKISEMHEFAKIVKGLGS